MTLAIYPGSFDPITHGHLNLIERGLKLFDHLVIAVSHNIKKQPLFSAAERMDMIREVMGPRPNVEIDTFEGLLVPYAKHKGAKVILRGLRAVSDFEFEFQMAHMNRQLGSGEIETVFMMAGEEHFYVSSSLVREVAHFGGSVTGLVPPSVERHLLAKLGKKAP